MQLQSQQQQQQWVQKHSTAGSEAMGSTPSQQTPLVYSMPSGIDISQPPPSIASAEGISNDSNSGAVGAIGTNNSYLSSSSPAVPPSSLQMIGTTIGSIAANNRYTSSLLVPSSSSSPQGVEVLDSFRIPPSRTPSNVTDDTTGESETDDGKD